MSLAFLQMVTGCRVKRRIYGGRAFLRFLLCNLPLDGRALVRLASVVGDWCGRQRPGDCSYEGHSLGWLVSTDCIYTRGGGFSEINIIQRDKQPLESLKGDVKWDGE